MYNVTITWTAWHGSAPLLTAPSSKSDLKAGNEIASLGNTIDGRIKLKSLVDRHKLVWGLWPRLSPANRGVEVMVCWMQVKLQRIERRRGCRIHHDFECGLGRPMMGFVG